MKMKKEFIDNLSKYLPQEEIDLLIKSLEKESKHGLLLNTDKMDENTLLSLFPHIEKHPFLPNGFIYDKKEYDLGKSIYHELGCFYLQEPSAMLVSYLLAPNENDILLDLCAAPGGKTIGASLSMNNKGLIIANDLSRSRTLIMQDNIQRLGRGNVLITNNDFAYIKDNYQNYFTKIILDAPCSGSGMFRKEEKMMQDWSINKVFKFSITQCALIDIAYGMLAPGGSMVYSTCSYSYEEDEMVIKHLLENTDAELLPIMDNELFYKSKEGIGIHLFPSHFPGEGHYICLIKKPGILNNKTKIPYNKNTYSIKMLEHYDIKNFNNVLYGLPILFSYKKLNIIQYGLKIGEIFSKNILFDYHLAHYINDYSQSISLDEKQTAKYISGEQIETESQFKGNVLLKYQGINIDFSKNNANICKNHYPKIFRKKDLRFN